MTRRAYDPGQAAIQFPLAAGDRAEFAAATVNMTGLNGACRVVRAAAEAPIAYVSPVMAAAFGMTALPNTRVLEADEEPPAHGLVVRVMCLNGSAKNGTEFDAYESELSR